MIGDKQIELMMTVEERMDARFQDWLKDKTFVAALRRYHHEVAEFDPKQKEASLYPIDPPSAMG